MFFERRRHPRVRVPGLSTPLGDVVNASESGLAVFCKGDPQLQPGLEMEFAVAFDGKIEQVAGIVERVEPMGPRGFEIGISFDAGTATLKQWLKQLAEGDPLATTGARVYRAA